MVVSDSEEAKKENSRGPPWSSFSEEVKFNYYENEIRFALTKVTRHLSSLSLFFSFSLSFSLSLSLILSAEKAL